MADLFDKIYGCIAASNIGSAMGAAVEGWDTPQIIEKFGVLKEFLPYRHYREYDKEGSGRERMPGTTEDGIERQRLMCRAIIEKKGRIRPEDLAKVWVRDIDPKNFAVQMENSDEMLYRLIKAGNPPIDVHGHPNFFPPTDAGRYQLGAGIVAFARSCHPIGIINAADPEQAAHDALEIGKMYSSSHDIALYWSAAVTSAIAEAMKPDATVKSVIETAKRYVLERVRHEIEEALEMADKYDDVFAMRESFNNKYCNKADLYCISMAYEVIAKGFAVFYKTNGDPKECIIGAVNFGRDTDCLAAVSAGIAGALNGTKAIPDDWIKIVDQATKANEYTVSKLTLKETSQGLYDALRSQIEKDKERIKLLEK